MNFSHPQMRATLARRQEVAPANERSSAATHCAFCAADAKLASRLLRSNA